MKFVIGGIVLLVVLFFAVPIIAGGSTNICQDVESHNVSNAASSITGSKSGPMYNVVNSVGQMGATGAGESAAQSSEHPHTPTVISCTTAYWQSL